MTEWWVSQKKHWCDLCKVWTGSHLWQIQKHKDGRMHIEHEEKMLKDAREREIKRNKEKKDVLDQLAQIERAAAAAMAGGGAQASSAAQGAAGPTAPAAATRQAEMAVIAQTVEEAKRRRIDAAAAAASSPGPDVHPGCPWTRHTDPNSKQYYYHNAGTGESAWHEPPEFAQARQQHLHQQAAAETAAAEAAAAAELARAQQQQQQAAAAARAAAAVAAPPPTLAAGSTWVICTDPSSGHVYFFNQATGQSSWEKPAELSVDLAKPPPPPSAVKPMGKKKEPVFAAAPRDATVGAVGMWEEVRPEESAFNQTTAAATSGAAHASGLPPDEPDSDEEETLPNAFAETKEQLMGKKGTWADEDLELRPKEMFVGSSSHSTFAPATGEDAAETQAFSSMLKFRKTGAGAAKRGSIG